MIDLVGYLKRMETRIPKVRIMRGVYVGRIDGDPSVDVDGERITAALIMPEPQVRDEVHVWAFQGQWFLTGLVHSPPSEGVVSVIGTERITVITERGDFSVPFMSTYTPSSGETVQLGYNGQGLHALGKLSVEVEPVEPPEKPKGAAASRRPDLFTATSSGTAARGTASWTTNQVYASTADIGIYTYGSKVRDTLAAAPPVTRLEVKLPEVFNRAGTLPPRLGWHPLEVRGGAAPKISKPRTVAPDAAGGWWVDITDLADDLRAGGGVGFDGAGYRIFAGIPMDGRAGDPEAGALRATY